MKRTLTILTVLHSMAIVLMILGCDADIDDLDLDLPDTTVLKFVGTVWTESQTVSAQFGSQGSSSCPDPTPRVCTATVSRITDLFSLTCDLPATYFTYSLGGSVPSCYPSNTAWAVVGPAGAWSVDFMSMSNTVHVVASFDSNQINGTIEYDVTDTRDYGPVRFRQRHGFMATRSDP